MTTTDLRTKSSSLVATLQKGGSVSLIHRSKIIGIIKPEKKTKKFDVRAFQEAVKNLHIPQLTYAQRDKIYRKHIMEKYGKGLS